MWSDEHTDQIMEHKQRTDRQTELVWIMDHKDGQTDEQAGRQENRVTDWLDHGITRKRQTDG